LLVESGKAFALASLAEHVLLPYSLLGVFVDLAFLVT
jgi:hypothetical protein